MNKRERVLNAFNNREVDRVPMGFWFHFVSADKLYKGLEDPKILEENIAGHQKYHDEFDMDFVKAMTDGLFYRPLDTFPKVNEPKDLYQIKALDHDHPYFTESLKHAKKLREIFGNDILIYYNICSPLNSLTKSVVGSSALKKEPVLLFEDLDAFRYACDEVGKDMAYLSELVMTQGSMDGIYMSTHNDTFIPNDIYNRCCAPSEIAVLQAANRINDNNIIHICGYRGRSNHLEVYRDYPVKVFNWATHSEGLSLKDGKEYFRNKAVIGGFDQMPDSLIVTGDKASIQNYVKDLVKYNGKTGLIIGADCTIPDTTPIEHLEWIREALEEIA